jgi:single stranded DNA-binding protein
MGNLNKMIVIGNLASKPRIFNDDPQKQAMVTGRVAANDYWKDAAGTKQKRTTWFNFVIFGKRAEAFYGYMDKGSCVYLEGDMREDTFNSNLKGYPAYNVDGTPVIDQNGAHFIAYVQVQRSELKLHVRDWKFMDSKPQGENAYPGVAGAAATPQAVAASFAPAAIPAVPAVAAVAAVGPPALAPPVLAPPVAAVVAPPVVGVVAQPAVVAQPGAPVVPGAVVAPPTFAVNAMPTGV